MAGSPYAAAKSSAASSHERLLNAFSLYARPRFSYERSVKAAAVSLQPAIEKGSTRHSQSGTPFANPKKSVNGRKPTTTFTSVYA